MLPSCAKLLTHFVEDPKGTVYAIDAAHQPPAPHFDLGVAAYQQKFLQAINQSPRADLTALLHRAGKPDVKSFSDLIQAPYAFSVALADLTGDETDPGSKVFHPPYAAFHDKDSIYPASLAKIGPIFAAHQLKFDALHKATLAPAAISGDPAKLKKWLFDQLQSDWTAKGLPADRQPVLKNLLAVTAGGVDFTDDCKKQMAAITHPGSWGWAAVAEMNKAMAFMMRNIHASYIGSALIQLGLCDQGTGGFWLWDAWGERWECGGKPAALYKGQQSSEVQAWSAATYLTLLEQRRLVSPDMSDQMKPVLKDGDTGWARGGLGKALPAAEVAKLDLWGKEGAWGGFASEALLIERTTGAGKKLRYVVACLLSSTAKASEYPALLAEPDPDDRTVYHLMLRVLVELLIPALDGVIVANNP